MSFDSAVAKKRCLRLRKRILDMSQKISALHIGSAYSCMEIVDAIYFGLMRQDASGKEKDTFLLSKGHGCLAQYVALEEKGVLTNEHIETYCRPEGILGIHPDYGNPGIEASTGSLGHGLAMGIGMAISDKAQGLDRQVYVVMSDGEFQEGSVWEAMMLAPSFKLNNLIAFMDLNDFQSLGKTSEYLPNFYPVLDKIKAFGWECIEVNGHDGEAIYKAVQARSKTKPFFVIAKTTKGKGVSYMENVPMWHYRSPTPDEYKIALEELERGLRHAQ